MQVYTYKVKTYDGKVQSGKIEARTEQHAVKLLKEKNFIVISLSEASDSGLFSLPFLSGNPGSSDLVSFTQQLSTMINAGMALTDSLNIIQVQSNPKLSRILNQILRDIEAGTNLSGALEKHPKLFNKIYVSLVKAGEASGKLDVVLERLAENEEQRREFTQKVRGALIYPIIVIIAMITVVFIMMIFVIPQLSDMYTEIGAELPLVTRILVAISNFTVRFWWLILGLVAFAGFSFRAWYRTVAGREQVDGYLLKIPVFGKLISDFTLTEFSRTLSLLISSGVSILEALTITGSGMKNSLFSKSIKNIRTSVEKGIPLAAALANQQIFPALMAQMMSVGEETGKLDSIMVKVSKHYQQNTEHKVKNLTTALEPIIMIVMGFGVAFLVFAIIMPIYNLTEQF